jgi:hypothetical protein
MSNNDEAIDLQKLSQRELLVLIHNKVEMLERANEEQTNKQMKTDIELAVIKTKITLTGAVVGFFSGIAGSIIVAIVVKMVIK